MRPKDLPDFANPPLDEVVLGIQFEPCPAFSSIYNGDIFRLFSDEYPSVEEHSLLQPGFETFGGNSPQGGFSFKFGEPPYGSRLWFISDHQDHLIQSQSDRLILNWRKRSKDREYPRFEAMITKYEDYFTKVDDFYRDKFGFGVSANQVEVSYINIIPIHKYSDVSDFLNIVHLSDTDVEHVGFRSAEIYTSEGNPYARLYYDLQSVVAKNGKEKALKLTLSFKGSPAEGDLSGVLDFMHEGRNIIVKTFAKISTDKAHKEWGRSYE